MRRMPLIRILGLALGWAVLVAPASRAQDDPPGIDPTHYWTYQLPSPVFFPVDVRARDAFFTGFTPIFLDSLTRLANWVSKDFGPVSDTLIRYTWWNIRNKLPQLSSGIITNQRGEFAVSLFNLEFMLVPAWKNQPQAAPPNVNHYLCYRADGPMPSGTYHGFRDEWRTDFSTLGPIEYVCAPCWKEHGGLIYPPTDPLKYLSLYPIEPLSENFSPFIQDQFLSGFRLVKQRRHEWVMLPSLFDVAPTATKTSTWGKLKTLYR